LKTYKRFSDLNELEWFLPTTFFVEITCT
jgi:hypothetical protein